ncbi:transposase [Streptomyces sp. 21So2-11]|uniref:transposase n=1 Tax=Streptomyces sp. 21So2-11 TaxID=3144408 RepID=UPI00321AC648
MPDRSPRVLGVDEFAFRKGCTYGTVLVDVEAGRVVDVLPDRTSKTFADWLRAHPGVEIVCRDRATAYTRAVKEAAPHALEIADRWHLLQNLSVRSRRRATSTATACANTSKMRRPRHRSHHRWTCHHRAFPRPKSSNAPVTGTKTSADSSMPAGPSAPSAGD